MGFFDNPLEGRTIQYMVREIKTGRKLFDVLEDVYVRNRIPEDRRAALLEDEQLLAAFEAELKSLPDVEDFDKLMEEMAKKTPKQEDMWDFSSNKGKAPGQSIGGFGFTINE